MGMKRFHLAAFAGVSAVLIQGLVLPAISWGAPPSPALRKSDREPVAGRCGDLVAPGRADDYTGDLVLHNEREAAAYVHVKTLHGSLTIAPEGPVTISLPALQTVTGAVDISVLLFPAATQVSSACGLGEVLDYVQSQAYLPALATIGGTLRVEQQPTELGLTVHSSYGHLVDLGLPALTDLGGDLQVIFGSGWTSACGLPALSEVPHDVLLSLGPQDHTGLGLLGALTQVGGSLTLDGGFTVSGVLPALQTVDGSTWVTGNGQLIFPALAYDMGELVIDHLRPEVSGLHVVLGYASDPITVGGLTLTDNPSLTSLATGGALRLALGAQLHVSGNPMLSGAEVCAFVAEQEALGWVPAGTGFICP